MEQYMDDNELPCFDLDLSDNTNDGANFRFENDPANPYERSNVIERRGLLHVRCTIEDIVHGQWSDDEDSNDEATLLVLLFRFDADDLGRRIKLARIKLSFSGLSSSRTDPEVARLWPAETYSILPTTRTETVSASGKGSLPMATQIGPEVSYERSKTVQRELQSMGTVRGSADTRGRNYGLYNSASWTLKENPDTRSGVAAALQCAVLVRRRTPEEEVSATVQVSVHADCATAGYEWIRGVFTQPRTVDPILFDPKRPPTNRLRVYDGETRASLGSMRLDDPTLTHITAYNVWDAAAKHE